MLPTKFRWVISFCVSVLVVIACSQVSVGMITPTAANMPVETPANSVLMPTSIPTSDPLVSPTTSDLETEISTAVPGSSIPALAYLGPDDNIWILEAGSLTPHQLTYDANQSEGDSASVEYGSLHLSSDSTLIAYNKRVNTPTASGYEITSGIWVLNLHNGEQRQILDGRANGMAWKPDTHLLAYGIGADIDYFMSRPDPTLATGIYAFDLDSHENLILVPPERGYTLASPNWSSDGRFLAFTEVINMEGSGLFTYHDFANQQYVAWDEAVGRTSWSPDGSLLAYARHTYAPTGEERLYMRPREGSEQILGPDYDGPAFATYPTFSPNRNQIAYLAFEKGPETYTATIMVLDLDNGEAKSLGQFEDVWEIFWTPDGNHLVFAFGHWESRQIIALNIADGNQTVLAAGSQPAIVGQ